MKIIPWAVAMFCYSSLFPCLFLGGSEVLLLFFLCGSGVFYLIFYSYFSLILISFRNGIGHKRVNIEWYSHSLIQILLEIIPHLKAHTFKESFQKCISSGQPKTGKGLGWEMWVFFSIPYPSYANWSLICLCWIRGSSAWSTGAKVTSQRSLWSSGSTAVHKNCSNICSIKVHMVSIFFTALLL